MSGMDMLLNSIVRLSGVSIEDAKSNAVKAWQTVVSIETSLQRIEASNARIEANQAKIMAKLEIDDGPACNGRLEQVEGNDQRNGSADPGGTGDTGALGSEAGAVVRDRTRKH